MRTPSLKISVSTRLERIAKLATDWWRAQLAQPAAAESVRLLPVAPRQAPLIAIGAGASSAVSVTVGAARIEASGTLHGDVLIVAR